MFQECGTIAAMHRENTVIATSTDLEAAIEPWLQHMTWRRDYARWRERRINQENYQGQRLAQLERVVGSLASMRLLDLGAGMGGFAVAAALGGAEVAVSEYNPAYCAISRLRAMRHGLRLPIVNAAGEALPFPKQHFDCVVCWDVIEHVQDPRQVLAEIARVLQPGGIALITVINRRAWVDPHYHMRGINWLPRPLAEQLIKMRGRTKQARSSFQDMQRLSEMHYFGFAEFGRLAQSYGFELRDMREEQLRAGLLHSPKPMRRFIRSVLRMFGLEQVAYRLERDYHTGMFELALVKR